MELKRQNSISEMAIIILVITIIALLILIGISVVTPFNLNRIIAQTNQIKLAMEESNSQNEQETVSREEYNKLVGRANELENQINDLEGQFTSSDKKRTELKQEITNLSTKWSDTITWNVLDIAELPMSTTSWGNNKIIIPEIKNARRVALFDKINTEWCFVDNVDNEVVRITYTNGVPDAYNFTAVICINFNDGEVRIVSRRIGQAILDELSLNNVNMIPTISKVAYTK